MTKKQTRPAKRVKGSEQARPGRPPTINKRVKIALSISKEANEILQGIKKGKKARFVSDAIEEKHAKNQEAKRKDTDDTYTEGT